MALNTIQEGYSIAIPAYGRPIEFEELLQSVYDMHLIPDEVLICEDFSKERKEIQQIAERYKVLFHQKNVRFNYIENEVNLGYDANVRKLIEQAIFKWVILIGNDDLFLKDGLQQIADFCEKHKDISMISRPFIRFDTDINKPIGVSRILDKETILKSGDSPKFIFRSCGFVGGLVINKPWAHTLATSKYDGTLYYQIYLAAHAFCSNGIGYLGFPSVAGRAGNPPLFGESAKDGILHIPGAYSAKGRASMWKGVLDIGTDVGKQYNINLVDELRQELMIRQACHVFEMNVGVSKFTLKELKQELQNLNLFQHWVPKFLFYTNFILGKYAYYFYFLIRKIAQ